MSRYVGEGSATGAADRVIMGPVKDLRVTQRDDGLLLEVYVLPRASRSQVSGIHDGRLKIALAAPPVDGAANEALVAFLAKELGLAKRDVTLVRGETSRQKLISLRGLPLDALNAWLAR